MPQASHQILPVAKKRERFISKSNPYHLARLFAPFLFAMAFATAANAQGTMDFSGAQTLMSTFKTFAMYAGAVICLGGLIFAGIRMMSGRFQDAIPGLFGALFGAGVLGWGAGWIGFDHGYAVTSHSSQGLTAERVLVNADTGVHPDLVNSRFGYVSVSRASHDATVFTDNFAKLAPQLSADVSKTSALKIAPAASVGQGIGLGISR